MLIAIIHCSSKKKKALGIPLSMWTVFREFCFSGPVFSFMNLNQILLEDKVNRISHIFVWLLYFYLIWMFSSVIGDWPFNDCWHRDDNRHHHLECWSQENSATNQFVYRDERNSKYFLFAPDRMSFLNHCGRDTTFGTLSISTQCQYQHFMALWKCLADDHIGW